jgi:hypothetical protein
MAGAAEATPWWVAWEGETWPEDSGWQRTTYGGGDERSLQDGVMTLDGRQSTATSDFYEIRRALAPGEPGEFLMVQWRLRVNDLTGFADPGVCISSQGDGDVTLRYAENAIYSLYEGAWIPFTPGLFHDYRLTSADLSTYALYIDEVLAYEGHFVGPGWESGVVWGDYTQGASSLSAWDYLRFGLVPEPSAALVLGSVGLAVAVVRTHRTKERK